MGMAPAPDGGDATLSSSLTSGRAASSMGWGVWVDGVGGGDKTQCSSAPTRGGCGARHVGRGGG
jgi:hypothetical protein